MNIVIKITRYMNAYRKYIPGWGWETATEELSSSQEMQVDYNNEMTAGSGSILFVECKTK